MNAARKGNGKEKATEHWLEERDWLVGSRRHIGGAGDILAVRPVDTRPFLIEVKATKTKWSHFGPADREALKALAAKHCAVPYLAWWERGAKEPQFIPASDWP